MCTYLVDADFEDDVDHNCYCDTYDEAIACAKSWEYEGHHCGIYKLVAEKNEWTGEIIKAEESE
jgi:hypothetical protein